MILYSIINEYDVLFAQEREMKYSCENLVKLDGAYITDLHQSLDLTKLMNIQNNCFNLNTLI